MATLIRDKYEAHKAEVNARFDQLRANEEELNRIFAEIYDMVGEVPIEVEDKYVSVARIFDTADEIPESFKGNNYVRTRRDEVVSLISYAVGCMFGRYSLDVDGLVLANQGDTVENYLAKMPDPAHVSFMPVVDNVLAITTDAYYNNDVCTLFERFLVAAYGEGTLEENLRYVADALSPAGKGTPRDIVRVHFQKEFFADHCKTYKKRPIYWLLDAGKKGSFRALIYLHRYWPDLMARIRTDYVLPLQQRYTSMLDTIQTELDTVEGRRRAALVKEQKRVADQAAELTKFEEKIHHLADQMVDIDLDDGVKVNYPKFGDVLAKIK